MISSDQAKPDKMKVGNDLTLISAKCLSEIVDLSDRAIRIKSDKENWKYKAVSVRGGSQKQFIISELPDPIRRAIRSHFGEIPEEMAECVPADLDAKKTAKCVQDWDSASEWQRRRASARLQIIRALEAYREEFTGSRPAALKIFLKLYAARTVSKIDPETYDEIPKISRSQLYEWERMFAESGISGLISRHGANRGVIKIPLTQQHFILGLIAKNPALKPMKLQILCRAKFGESRAERRQIARFLDVQRVQNPAVFSYILNPDRYKSKFQLALGSASAKAAHFLHYVEVDSTPADVLCSDGRRYTIIGLCDVFSRKVKFLVTKTSNSWGIAGLLRSVILDWGLPENIVRDNGQDYASRMVNEALTALQIEVVQAPPFTPEAKPHIERAFKTMSHGLMEGLPGFVGHNVPERKDIESRKSFADRLMKAGEKLEIGLTPGELQSAIDTWAERVYHQRVHSGLGMSPNAKAASVAHRVQRITDSRAVDILLAPASQGGVRIIGKKGIKLDNQVYWTDDLIDWIGRKVLVRMDVRDAGRVFCFDPATKTFIGEAVDLAIAGITVGELIAARKKANKRVKEQVKALKSLAEDGGDTLLEAEIKNARRDNARLSNLPVGTQVKDNPFVDAAMAAANSSKYGELFPDQPVPPPELASLYATYEPEPAPADPKIVNFRRKQPVTPEDRYFKNFRERFEYLRKKQRIEALRPDENKWLDECLNEWLDHAEMWVNGWPECDQLWLRKIAPDHFSQFVQEDSK